MWRAVPRILRLRQTRQPPTSNCPVCNSQQSYGGMLVVHASIRSKFDSSRDPCLFFGQPQRLALRDTFRKCGYDDCIVSCIGSRRPPGDGYLSVIPSGGEPKGVFECKTNPNCSRGTWLAQGPSVKCAENELPRNGFPLFAWATSKIPISTFQSIATPSTRFA